MAEFLIVVGTAIAAILWVAMAIHVMVVRSRRTRMRTGLAGAAETLRAVDVALLPLTERVARLRPMLARASRETLMYGATDAEATPEVVEGLTAYLVDRWGLEALERDAETDDSPRSKWRRMTALRILTRLGHPRSFELLARAAQQDDGEVASVAFAQLGTLDDDRAGDALIAALTAGRHPASRIAVHLHRSPLSLEGRLRPLISDPRPAIRYWGVALLGRYVDAPGLEAALLPLAHDADPAVRKAAVDSLGRIGGGPAADVAVGLLDDPVAFVRAHAVRALGQLDRFDLAGRVAESLGDRDWWVRFAAKQTLGGFGPEVWSILMPYLESADQFARNGAAEVFQNLGVVDSLIVMEAASDDPSPQKIDLLRRIAAAGGVRLADSIIERAGPVLRPRVRGLLAGIGLETVGAA